MSKVVCTFEVAEQQRALKQQIKATIDDMFIQSFGLDDVKEDQITVSITGLPNAEIVVNQPDGVV